ncbi:ubiquinol oxidase subunit II [Palleronia caenipelagi]|uniref:Ubiquinol oxidase subunit 2 n=1 Tax=Palleronia caenipelagi TaxID=2489174 RepID=A0A547Q7P8_9RHOB|nr:ubiquinol oxidase subunit II [Palleronia caenipelagi]TRD22404.1 ubiquinol oxidase subunit II [Palleronia caenipelagi]
MTRRLLILGLTLFLAGCQSDVLSPSGWVAEQLRDVLLITTILILLIVAPVMVAIVVIAKKYHHRAGQDAPQGYDPAYAHSNKLELLIWAAPLVIIMWLGAITWVTTHKLDPYRALDSAATGVEDGEEELVVKVVALDWKWLFFYPEQGIAVVNESAAPVDVPIEFGLTASDVMNAFYIPALAGMIYTMPGMETELNAVVNEPGAYKGRSSHYSGAGFSGMRFTFHGMSNEEFDAWVEKVRAEGTELTREAYLKLAEPTSREKVRYYTVSDPDLYHDILNRCVEEGQTCIDEMDHGTGGGSMTNEGHDGDGAHGDASESHSSVSHGTLDVAANEQN